MSFESLYTPTTTARDELMRRRSNPALEAQVKQYVQGVVPELFRTPRLCLFRHIASVTRETERLLLLAEELGLAPCITEYTADKFYAGNIDKHVLLQPRFRLGTWTSGRDRLVRLRIADVVAHQGQPFSNIITTYGTPLTTFHHELVEEQYPRLKDSYADISEWLHRFGDRARSYYKYFFSLFVTHGILAETFEYAEAEESFCSSVVIPAYQEVRAHFSVPPLVVKLTPPESVHDQNWWYPDVAARDAYLRKHHSHRHA